MFMICSKCLMQLELPFDASTYVERPGGRNVSSRRRRTLTGGEQFVLPGCGIRQLENLFFCLQPPTAAAAQADDIARRFSLTYGLRARIRGERLYHASLHGIGTYDTVPPALSTRAIEVARTVRMPPFNAHFDRIISFANKDNNNPLVLLGGGDQSALQEFYGRLGDALRTAGFKRIQKSFTRT